MINAFIPPKALLVVDKSLNAVHNDIIVAIVSGEFTIKLLLITNVGPFLAPANPKFKPRCLLSRLMAGTTSFILNACS